MEVVKNIAGDNRIFNELKERNLAKEREEAKYLFGEFGRLTNYLFVAEDFLKVQPIYYDNSKIWWIWNRNEFKWDMVDETDIFNLIDNVTKNPSTNGSMKSEMLEALRRVARKHKPKEAKKSWVQFKNKIYDVENEDCFEATSEYFITNPIPWKVGESEETPYIDKLLSDWIEGQDESWKDTLYQIIAYNLSSHKFMQRIISLCGGGSNGKGTFIKLNYKFMGEDNCVSSEIKNLSEDKFEPAVLHRKLLCVMGEVSYGDLRNTNMLKKLGGEDKISFQFKGKTPFTEHNTATCICLTNSMPITPDKTRGFYRKWLIIDFIKQFDGIDKDLIEAIPDLEFENLARKSLRILRELYKKPHFINEGDFDERAKRYEERSNPIMNFIEDECEETEGLHCSLRDFTNACNKYLKEKHLRIFNSNQVGKILRNEGFLVGNRKIKDISAVVVMNLSLKLFETIRTTQKPSRNTQGNANEKMGSSNSLGSFIPQKKFTTEEIEQSAPEVQEYIKNKEKESSNCNQGETEKEKFKKDLAGFGF